MEIQRFVLYINKTCPRPKKSHKGDHTIFSIPGRTDVCFAFCEGWGSRLFLVWERDGKFQHMRIAGASGYQITPHKDSIKIEETIVGIYVSVDNWIGSSGGAHLYYDLGKPGQAQPVASIKSKRSYIGSG